MELNILNITDALAPLCEWKKILNASARFVGFSGLVPECCEDKILYIWSIGEDALPEVLPETCILVHTATGNATLAVTNCIALKEGVTKLQALAVLESTFRKFNNWSDQLKESLINESGVKALMELSIPIFQNPLCFMNLEFRVLFLCDVPNGVKIQDIYGDQLLEKHIAGEKMMQTIISSDEYLNVMAPFKVFLWKEKIWGGQFMNINSADYCLFLSDCNGPFREGDGYLLKYLHSVILQSIGRRNLYPARSIDDLRQIIANATSTDCYMDENSIEKLSAGCGWSISDIFVCAVIYPSAHDLIRKTMLYYCNQLEALFTGTAAFTLDDKIIAIIDLTQLSNTREYVINTLAEYLRSRFLLGSLSTEFSPLYSLQPYIQQAIAAYKTGTGLGEQCILFLFENYALQYMLHHASGGFDVQQLMPQGLLELLDYDQQNQSHYLQVLQTYLENKCNITDSTNKLYMHRNTFLYQLDKIKKIVNLDLDDNNVRLLLQLVLRLYNPDI